ncbi:MAG TPA: phosphotransferase [Thermoanaerobaculia bacterium]|nr:phosphotransferase [Thermoanaerobaculia bacterium]
MSEVLQQEAARTELESWLSGRGFQLQDRQDLAGDVSPRRYARLAFADGTTAILATYPPEVQATCPRFQHTTRILEEAGVPVPRILGVECERGWMLVEDLGPQTLGDWKGRSWSELEPYFAHALDLAGRIARLPTDGLADLNPVLGQELMTRELRQTWDLFLEPQGLLGDAGRTAALQAVLDEICARLAAEAPVPCHRDFMARNLMPLPSGRVVVLDHQDLRLGPPAYDLASLLNDTLFPPPEAEEALLARALPAPGDRQRYHRAAAQRTLKAVGTYASFARRGADRHVPLIAPTLGRFLDHLARLPEGAALAGDLRTAWRPAL